MIFLTEFYPGENPPLHLVLLIEINYIILHYDCVSGAQEIAVAVFSLMREILMKEIRDLGIPHLRNTSLVPRVLSYPSLQSEREPGNEVAETLGRMGPSLVEVISGIFWVWLVDVIQGNH